MNLIDITPKESIIFEDNKVIVALAYEPISKGHCVVIWKDEKEDINKLETEDYEYLMDVVDVTRDSLRSFYGVEKVYLVYLDETNWVHWHLIPVYDKKGFDVFNVKSNIIKDFKDKDLLMEIFHKRNKEMMMEK